MTRLFTDGAEFGDLLFFTNAGAVTASTTQKRTGAYSYRSGGYANYATKSISATDGEIYLREAIRLDALNNCVLMRVKNNNGGETQFSLKYYASPGSFAITSRETDTVWSTSAGYVTIQSATWHLIEIHFKLHDTLGKAQLKVDGIACAEFSGDTKENIYTGLDTIWFYEQGQAYYFDDIACNNIDNTDGLNDNSWCGDGRVELLSPNGNGNVNEWTGSDSNSTDNYALVDEVPSSSSDYVEDSTPGNQDAYTLTDFSGTGKTILRVWAEARAIDTVPEGAQIKLGLRTNSTDYLSSEITLGTTYQRIKGTDYKINPNDSAAWEDADLDGLELVLETV